MNITVELLRSIDACSGGVGVFKAKFPSGEATWAELVAAAETGVEKEHLAWLGRHCPAGVEGATWEARLALQRNGGGRTRLCWYCPAGVEGATFEARLAVKLDDEERARLDKLCPKGVEGGPR